MATVVVDMYKNYDCKNSVRFDAVNGNMAAINAVYIRNSEMAKLGANATKLRITIETVD